MIRNIDIYLRDWKIRKNRKPLILRGARQVGKTWSVDKFSENFEYYIKIDFEENPEATSLFRDNNIDRITSELSLATGTPANDGQTLVFLDECQLCPGVFKSLRYFREKRPNLHVIAAGSLIDFTLNDLQYPMPVGRVEFLYMYPLSFKEFLTATGKGNLKNFISGFQLTDSIPPIVHNQLLEILRNYYFIGGMPETVKEYVEGADLINVQRIQTGLSASMRNDFMKYGEKREQPYLTETFLYTARNPGRKIKYSNINRTVRSAVIKYAIEKLEAARIIHPIYHSSGSGVPLGGNAKPEHFKTAFVDIGLSNRICGLDLTDTSELMTIREGLLAEQFAAQELTASFRPFEDRELYYWIRQRKNSNAEVDYLTAVQNSVIPVEIKAGTTGGLKSLQVFMASKKNLPAAVRFSLLPASIEDVKQTVYLEGGSVETNFKLLNLPLYMISETSRLVGKLLGSSC